MREHMLDATENPPATSGISWDAADAEFGINTVPPTVRRESNFLRKMRHSTERTLVRPVQKLVENFRSSREKQPDWFSSPDRFPAETEQRRNERRDLFYQLDEGRKVFQDLVELAGKSDDEIRLELSGGKIPVLGGREEKELEERIVTLKKTVVNGKVNIREAVSGDMTPEDYPDRTSFERAVKERTRLYYDGQAVSLCDAEVHGYTVASVLKPFSPEDQREIEKLFIGKIKAEIERAKSGQPPKTLERAAWLKEWEENIQHEETLPVQINEKLRSFGQFIVDHKDSLPPLVAGFLGGMGGRAAGGMVLGTFISGGGYPAAAAVGALGGAVGGATAEYIRQVGANIKKDEVVAGPDMVARQKAFKEKLFNKENWTRVNGRQVGKAALKGMVTGSLGGMFAHWLSGLNHVDAAGQATGFSGQEASAITGHEGAVITGSVEPLLTPSVDQVPTMDNGLATTGAGTSADVNPSAADIGAQASAGEVIPGQEGVADKIAGAPDSSGASELSERLKEDIFLRDSSTSAGAASGAAEGAQAVAGNLSVEDLAKIFGQEISLPADSNPWNLVDETLKQVSGGKDFSPAEIQAVTKVLCQENDINVPAWGIKGAIPDTNIPAGFKFQLTPAVFDVAKKVISSKMP